MFTLRGSLEAIEHGIGEGDQLRRAQDKAKMLDGLVGDLFTFSRLEYAGPELECQTLDAAALAREAAAARETCRSCSSPCFAAIAPANSKTGGAGLGLAIVDRLSAAQGATVHAENLPGRGARFSIRMPVTTGGSVSTGAKGSVVQPALTRGSRA